MIFTETHLAGAFIIDFEEHVDERGFFARAWCQEEFGAHGLNARLVQCSVSRSRLKGTLRGLHYQVPPHAEAKTVRCTRGAIFDVIVDLRPDSPTRFGHVGVELTADNHRALYVPEGFAHGLLTLADDTEVLYLMSRPFHAESARGVRWNDPAFGIEWPGVPVLMSSRDAEYATIRPDAWSLE
jgi:dTDP-4-dehydrorhamnose 3,5-epimerase